MLRDIPRIYLLIFGFVTVIYLLVAWYQENFLRDSDVLQLNEIILTNAVTEVDHASRLYNYQDGSVYMLDYTFESAVWERLESIYPEGSDVMFAYKFDTEDTRFLNVEEGAESSLYTIGETEPVATPEAMAYMTGRPILEIEVRVREADDKIAGDGWTYVSSVAVDRLTKFND